MNLLSELNNTLKAQANPKKAKDYQCFFKTGKGEYGEGDRFLGITMPDLRKLARQYRTLPFSSMKKLIQSPWHEKRMMALLILMLQYQKTDDPITQTAIYTFYTDHLDHINHWDLIDVSAPHLAGHYLFDKSHKLVLRKWGKSGSIWRRRVAILATFYFIRNQYFQPTLMLAKLLLHDQEDLIHKAAGWMLREIGKRDQALEETFLRQHYCSMPRTMLRYAIERFDEKKRQQYLKGEI